MVLVNCKECGGKVNTKAKTCPNCGVKPQKKFSLITWSVSIFIIFVIYSSLKILNPSLFESLDTETRQVSATTQPAIDGSVKTIKKNQWTTSKSTDEMTGAVEAFALSPTVLPTKRMDFPYNNINSWLGVGCTDSGNSVWVYIGFNSSPNLSDTKTESGYNLIKTRIKWDDSIKDTILTQKWGSSFLNFENDAEDIKNMNSADSALLELSWHGQGLTYFKYPLDGFSDAIRSMLSICGK